MREIRKGALWKLLTHNNVILWFLLMELGAIGVGQGSRYGYNNT